MVADQLSLDFDVVKLIHSIDFLELLSQMRHQRSNVLIWPQLATIADGDATERTLFLSLPIISLNAIGAESMEARLVNDRIGHHFLANRTSQILHDSLGEVGTDHIVEGERLGLSILRTILVLGVVDHLALQLLLLFLVVIGQLQVVKLAQLLHILSLIDFGAAEL